jgi:DNA polymerase I-like protein with 3'-5' exonuclease and polymerase domains
MKQITNWRKGTVVDIETDNLLEELTKCHVVSFQMEGKSEPSSIKGSDLQRIKDMLKWHIDNKIPIVGHNFILFDAPALEKVTGMDVSELMVIDTLALSWYLNTFRKQHGLDSFHDDYGIKKPEVADWQNLSYEEYKHRCEEDVKINKALWEDFKNRLITMYTMSSDMITAGLVGGSRVSPDEEIYIDSLKGMTADQHIERFLTFLMFKLDTYRIQEKVGILLDKEFLEKAEADFGEKVEVLKQKLETVMPKIPKYTKKKKPAKPTKQNGDLSAAGLAWEEVKERFNSGEVDEFGTRMVLLGKDEPTLIVNGVERARRVEDIEEFQVFSKYEEPNANSPDQIKSFLYSHGWVPETFKEIKDKEADQKWQEEMKQWRAIKGRKPKKPERPVARQVPQVTIPGDDGKELCPSVERLAEDVPEIKVYSNLNLYKHRHGVVKGLLNNMDSEGRVKATLNGLTNTLRVKHKNVVNLVGVDKIGGKEIRGGFISDEGMILLGSDLSSLEDRTKHHFMLPLDPEYVSTMMEDDFDPHLLMAVTAGFISMQDMIDYKAGNKKPHVAKGRKLGKSTNYSAVYGAGAPKIAQTAGVDESTGKQLHTAYWDLNWSVTAIADEQQVVEFDQDDHRYSGWHKLWLINPINGFLYSLRARKDIFSTLCQGTGSYFFDVWVSHVLRRQKETFGLQKIQLQMHDEIAFCFKDTPRLREVFFNIVKEAIHDVNKEFKLRRTLDNDIQFGHRYSDIH